MSKDNLPQQNSSDEVDLGVLFNAIGRFFNHLFKFFKSIFNTILLLIILPLKLMLKYYKIIFLGLVVAAALGFLADNYKKELYESKMIVKPFFDSKYELIDNIEYYNSLISDRNIEQLTNVFEVDEEYAKSLVKFEISKGPETENERRLEFEEFITKIDSLRASEITFEGYDNNRNMYAYNSYKIKVLSKQKDGFSSLEKGLNKSLISPYAIKQKQKQDSILAIEKIRVLNSLSTIDSLQTIYKKVLREQSSTDNVAGFNVKDGLILQEKTRTFEVDLINKEVELRRQLSLIESEIVENSNYFEVLSSFQNVGSVYKPISTRYKFIFPLLVFVGIVVFFYTKKVILFIKEY